MSHRGQLPKAQPRTLRTIAENKGTRPAGFDGEMPYDAAAGVPAGTFGTGQYRDEAAETAQPGPSTKGSSADPKPFK